MQTVFDYDFVYIAFMSLNFFLMSFSMLYTFNLQSKDKKAEDAFKALVMMGTSMTFFVVIEWLRNAN